MDEIGRCDRCGGVHKKAAIPADLGFVVRCTCGRRRAKASVQFGGAVTGAGAGGGGGGERSLEPDHIPGADSMELREILGG